MEKYDGVLRKPFHYEHWYKGFAAAMAIWLPAFLLAQGLGFGVVLAVTVASLVSISLALAAITYHEGFSVEPSLQRYRSYVWVMGLRFGKWQPIPPIKHVVIKAYQQEHYMPVSHRPNPIDLGFRAMDSRWQVLLSVVGSRVGIIAAYTSHEKATEAAFALGKVLDVEVVTA